MGATCWIGQLGFPVFPTRATLGVYLRACEQCEEEEDCSWVGNLRRDLRKLQHREKEGAVIDWDEIQRETGWNEVDWGVEVSVENPFCPVLERNGYLPNSLNGMESIFKQSCTACFLWTDSPPKYPACPWAAAIAEEIIEMEELIA